MSTATEIQDKNTSIYRVQLTPPENHLDIDGYAIFVGTSDDIIDDSSNVDVDINSNMIADVELKGVKLEDACLYVYGYQYLTLSIDRDQNSSQADEECNLEKLLSKFSKKIKLTELLGLKEDDRKGQEVDLTWPAGGDEFSDLNISDDELSELLVESIMDFSVASEVNLDERVNLEGSGRWGRRYIRAIVRLNTFNSYLDPSKYRLYLANGSNDLIDLDNYSDKYLMRVGVEDGSHLIGFRVGPDSDLSNGDDIDTSNVVFNDEYDKFILKYEGSSSNKKYTVATKAIPFNKVETSISFTDACSIDGLLEGELEIKCNMENVSKVPIITDYEVHWINEHKDPLINAGYIASLPADMNKLSYYFPSETPVPMGATGFMVKAFNDGEEYNFKFYKSFKEEQVPFRNITYQDGQNKISLEKPTDWDSNVDNIKLFTSSSMFNPEVGSTEFVLETEPTITAWDLIVDLPGDKIPGDTFYLILRRETDGKVSGTFSIIPWKKPLKPNQLTAVTEQSNDLSNIIVTTYLTPPSVDIDITSFSYYLVSFDETDYLAPLRKVPKLESGSSLVQEFTFSINGDSGNTAETGADEEPNKDNKPTTDGESGGKIEDSGAKDIKINVSADLEQSTNYYIVCYSSNLVGDSEDFAIAPIKIDFSDLDASGGETK